METGKDFNIKNKGTLSNGFKKTKYIKLTMKDECHNGWLFKDGLNIDPHQFNPNNRCDKGGFYFCKYSDFPLWLHYANKDMHYIRTVTIPDDAIINAVKDYAWSILYVDIKFLTPKLINLAIEQEQSIKQYF